jgi:hypothetical protein
VGAETYITAKKLAQKNFQNPDSPGTESFSLGKKIAVQLKIGEEISAPGDLV